MMMHHVMPVMHHLAMMNRPVRLRTGKTGHTDEYCRSQYKFFHAHEFLTGRILALLKLQKECLVTISSA
jgi:hypothetical protein